MIIMLWLQGLVIKSEILLLQKEMVSDCKARSFSTQWIMAETLFPEHSFI